MWTLKYNGVEKALVDWGILDDFEARFVNKAKSTIDFRTNERFDPGAPQFLSFHQWLQANPAGAVATQYATVFRDRTGPGAGGTKYFQGFFSDPVRLAAEGFEHIHYLLHDVLWLMERNPFKQHRNQFNGWTVPGQPSSGATVVDKVCPEIFLGENLDGSLMTNGQQISEVLAWMNETYNPTRRGATAGVDATKDVLAAGTINPAAKIPKNRANTIFCIEACNAVLRWAPDAIYKLDHTTTPPTLHVLTMGKWNYATTPPTFVDYSNLPEVVVNITADQETEIQLQTLYGRQLPGVIVYYLSTATVDTAVVPVIVRDAFPSGISDFYPEVASHAVDLEGFKLTHVSVTPVIGALPIADAVTGDAAHRKAWWLAHNKALNDPKIDGATIAVAAATVVDDAGVAITLANFPNELLKPLPDWIKTECAINVVRAHVKAEIAYAKWSDSGHLIPDTTKAAQYVTFTCKLTNALGQAYTATKSFDPGETAPLGVAESVYRGLAIAQNAGTIKFSNSQLRSDIFIGCRLKLIGPNTTFTNLLPQMITARPHAGTTTVRFGPSAPIDADALIELARATRLRYIYNMPSDRLHGRGQSNETVDYTMDSPSENTGYGTGGEQLKAVTYLQIP